MSNAMSGADLPVLRVNRRLGLAPAERADCTSSGNCPDVFELATGDFAIIGTDVSLELDLPADAGRSETERIVVVPRGVMLAAVRDLSSSL